MSAPETNARIVNDQDDLRGHPTRWKWVAGGVAAVVIIGGVVGVSAVRSSNEGVAGALGGTTAGGVVTTLNAAVSGLDAPYGSATDDQGNLYIANGTRIQKFNPTVTPMTVTTLAGGISSGWLDATGTAARFKGAQGVAVDKNGTVYVAEAVNRRIRKITTAGVVTTLAGSGVSGSTDATGTEAQFKSPTKIAVDGNFNVYVLDSYRIRKITSAGVVTTVAGTGTRGFADGVGTAAKLDTIGIAIERNCTGSCILYLADMAAIRSFDTTSGQVTTLAGNTNGVLGTTNGVGSAALFNELSSITMAGPGALWVSDGRIGNPVIRRFDIASRTVSAVAGSTSDRGLVDATGSAATFNEIYAIAVTKDGTRLYVTDRFLNGYVDGAIRKVT
ncbi:MAG: hypothetical protein F2911_08165 [Actinobacteria bacterium]|uniref:Unannotated protein n=1 Tax=freshwater metagenome TaxID=449393 RepID=A0A6J7S505_9ZZZZ|nr:hypothetical protein [Actinomycetota bacterium]